MASGRWLILLILIVLATAITQPLARADNEPNVGILKIADLGHPRQVAPSDEAAITIDVVYAIRESPAAIRVSIFQGTIRSLGQELWHGDTVTVSGGGDQLWTAKLTAPASEQTWPITAIAFFEESGKWSYYNDTLQGPGFSELSIKVSKTATLQVQVGISGIDVKIGETTRKTGVQGVVEEQLAVGREYSVAVEPVFQLENSTRLLFVGWDDGVNQTERTVLLDGDLTLRPLYRLQYLLQVNSPVSSYASSEWYDPDSNVTLAVPDTVPAVWPLGVIGVKYLFKGWSGALVSQSTEVTLIVDKPKVVNADFVVDYSSAMIPTIIAVGIFVGLVMALAARKGRRAKTEVQREPATEQVSEPPTPQSEPTATMAQEKTCPSCGKAVEEEWTHCIKCGAKLPSPETVKRGES